MSESLRPEYPAAFSYRFTPIEYMERTAVFMRLFAEKYFASPYPGNIAMVFADLGILNAIFSPIPSPVAPSTQEVLRSPSNARTASYRPGFFGSGRDEVANGRGIFPVVQDQEKAGGPCSRQDA